MAGRIPARTALQVFLTARQVGKTTAAAIAMAHTAIFKLGSVCRWLPVLPSVAQLVTSGLYEYKPRKSPNCNEPTVTFTTVRLCPLLNCESGAAAIKDCEMPVPSILSFSA
jgi:hypothetical protein